MSTVSLSLLLTIDTNLLQITRAREHDVLFTQQFGQTYKQLYIFYMCDWPNCLLKRTSLSLHTEKNRYKNRCVKDGYNKCLVV